jgi:hypothetical protein
MSTQQQQDLAERFERVCTAGAGEGPAILHETMDVWRDAIGEQVTTILDGYARRLNECTVDLSTADFADCVFIPQFVLGMTNGFEWIAVRQANSSPGQHTYEVEAI